MPCKKACESLTYNKCLDLSSPCYGHTGFSYYKYHCMHRRCVLAGGTSCIHMRPPTSRPASCTEAPDDSLGHADLIRKRNCTGGPHYQTGAPLLLLAWCQKFSEGRHREGTQVRRLRTGLRIDRQIWIRESCHARRHLNPDSAHEISKVQKAPKA